MSDETPSVQAHPKTVRTNAALARLGAFIGAWDWEAAVGGQSIGRAATAADPRTSRRPGSLRRSRASGPAGSDTPP